MDELQSNRWFYFLVSLFVLLIVFELAILTIRINEIMEINHLKKLSNNLKDLPR